MSSPPDALNIPSVLPSPSGDVVVGSSLTLTCGLQMGLTVGYKWYKKNGNSELPSNRIELHLVTIQSSDSGEYYCTAENEMGKKTSMPIFIDVKCEWNNLFVFM